MSLARNTYHYDNASWRDLLTSITINGTTKEIKYPKDSAGNVKAGTPLSWYNGSEFTLDWTNGTQLASAKKGLALKTSYDYDIAGVRSSKTVGTTKYKFTTLSGLVMRQEWGARQMDFIYDENNQPYALSYKSGKNVTPVMYYYLLNQQGDVEALMDANGAIVATYEYDPWGAVTVKNANGALDNDDTSIGNMNPLRYRGYYYDNETGFYYLESRYYDPVVGRFISADAFASTGQGVLGCNMFAYCNNDPICWSDPSGEYRMIDGYEPPLKNTKKGSGTGISGGAGSILSRPGQASIHSSGNNSSRNGPPKYSINITCDDSTDMFLFTASMYGKSAFTAWLAGETTAAALAAAAAAPATGGLSIAPAVVFFSAFTGCMLSLTGDACILVDGWTEYEKSGSITITLYLPSTPQEFGEWLASGPVIVN